jgi:simple sugar transport system permease protein
MRGVFVDIINLFELISRILIISISVSAPYIFAGIGEMFSQKSGVLNLGVEGIMMVGAFSAFYFTWAYNNVLLGIAVSLIVGAVMGLLMGFVSITLKAKQGISGIGIYMLGWGTAGTLFRLFIGGVESIDKGVENIDLPVLGRIPYLGRIFFSHNILVYAAFLLVPLSWYLLYKTPWGLKVRAVGSTPRAADTMGISVNKIRYQCVIIGSTLAGLAGAYLSIAQANMFTSDLIAGRGFIAVALVYFGRWKPFGVLKGALLFSTANAFQRWFQISGINFPYEVTVILPYLLIIVVLAFSHKGFAEPTALTVPYDREFKG